MAIMIHAKFHFNQLMLTLIFGIWASEPPGPGERLKRQGLIGSVQSALSDLKRPPERLQSQCNYRPFIT